MTLKVTIHPNAIDPTFMVYNEGKAWDFLVEKLSEQSIHLDITPGLFPTSEAAWAAADGRVDIAVAGLPPFSADVPIWNFGQLPFMVNTVDEFAYATQLNPAFMQIFKPTFEEKNLVYLGTSYVSMQYLWTPRPLEKVEDFKGLKMRTSGVEQTNTVKALGASGVSIPVEEYQQALQRGTVDGLITGVHNGWRSGFYKMVKYINTWPITPTWQVVVMINKDAWNKLHPFQQNALLSATGIAENIAWGWGAAQNTEALAASKDLGIVVVTPSASEIEKVRPIVQPVYDDWVKRAGPKAQPLIDAVNAGLAYYRKVLNVK